MRYIIILLLVLLAIAMGSCTVKIDDTVKLNGKLYLDRGDVQVVEVDGCEYVLHTATYASSIVHKGNCKNPIHKP